MAAIAPAIKPTLIMNAGQAMSFNVLAETAAVPIVIAPFMPADQDAAAFASSLGVPDISTDENPVLHMDKKSRALDGRPRPTVCYGSSSSSNSFACCKSRERNPSVNQP